ncbi:rhodanese-like domain-containing protein [Methylophaga sp.]|uniref:rhodanese-like domain-containing protein n=1 Tax=Methylophaga sp. TaxID=2024840 RepID=UPI003F69662D
MNTKTISAEELISNLENEKLCLVDVRTPAEVRQDALDSIIAIPVDQLTPDMVTEKIEQNQSDTKQIYLICQSGKRAYIAAEKLSGKVGQELIVVEGGMNAIRASQGDPIKTRSVMSLERQVRLAAGSIVLTGVLLGYLFNTNWFLLSGFVGAGLIYAAITDNCAMGIIMSKAPWNR